MRDPRTIGRPGGGLRVVGPVDPKPSPSARQEQQRQDRLAREAQARQDRLDREGQARQDKLNAAAERTRLAEQARQDRLNRQAQVTQVRIARIEAAGAPQKTLNSVLTGIGNLERQQAALTDLGSLVEPAKSPSLVDVVTGGGTTGTATGSGLPVGLLIVGGLVAVWWLFLRK